MLRKIQKRDSRYQEQVTLSLYEADAHTHVSVPVNPVTGKTDMESKP
jgi:hypothetical protein